MLQNALDKISQASRLLLEHGFSNDTVPVALAEIGRAMDVDRVYVFENSTSADGELLMTQRFEWSAASAEPQIDNPELQNLPYAEAGPHWVAPLSRGDDVHGLVRLMQSPTRELLESQEIKSILVCPITVGKEWWGFVGFDDCRRERDWPASEIGVLKALARALSGSLRQAKMRANLEQTRASLEEVIRRCAPAEKQV